MWQDLMKTALIGTDKAADDENTLLVKAATQHLRERAGYTLRENPHPLPDPAPADTLPACNQQAADLLKLVLVERDYRLLEEWVTFCAEAGQRAPAAQLPSLLNLTKNKTHLYAPLIAVSGERGRWLSRHMVAWQSIFYVAQPEDWQNPSLPAEARANALRLWRKQDPTQARQALAERLGKELSDTRLALVEALETRLSPDDEPLLESLLDDKSVRVARAAADLLARLPGSQFVERMKARVKACITLKQRKRKAPVTLTLPAALDDSMKRDTVDRPEGYGHDDANRWLYNMIRAVPPSCWNEWLDDNTEDLIKFMNTEPKQEHQTVFIAWQHAAITHKEMDTWLVPLLTWYLHTDHVPNNRSENLRAVALALPPEKLEPLILQVLRGRNAKKIAGDMPLICEHEWSADFTAEVIDYCVALINDYSMIYHAISILPYLAGYGHPSQFEKVQTTFAPFIDRGYFSNNLDKALHTLKRRHDLWRTFGKL